MPRRVYLSPAERRDLTRLVATEVDHRLARRNPDVYRQQVQGVVDTVMNRLASDEFPDTLAGVANQSRQFSAINGPRNVDYKVHGSLDKVPDSVVPEGLGPLVEGWIDARAQGAPSSVGGNLHYANPRHSSPNNMVWINRLSGPRYGEGQSVHWHGTTDGFTPVEATVAPLPPGEVPEGDEARNAVAAIGEATGNQLPYPSLENLNAYFEQPDSVRSLLAPIPAPAGNRPRIAPIPAPYEARPSAPPVARSLLDDSGSRETEAPLDLMLSGAPTAITSRLDDSGIAHTPWLNDPQQWEYSSENGPQFSLRPDIPSGGLAGQDGGVWRTPAPDIPGRMVGEDRFTPRSLTADNSDPFDGFNALRPDPELAQSVADYATRQSNLETLLGSSNTSFAAQDASPARSLLGIAPQPATMSAGLSASRRAPTPQMPSRSLTDSRRPSAPTPATQSPQFAVRRAVPAPATPSASLTRSRNRPTPATQSAGMAADRAIPFPASQSTAMRESRQPPFPATQSASLLADRTPMPAARLPELAPPMEQGDGQPPAPSNAYRFDSASYDAPFGAFDAISQDPTTSIGLADFIAGQSAQAATSGSFDDMMGVEPRLAGGGMPSAPNGSYSSYPSPAEIEAATPFRFPDAVTENAVPAIPDPSLAQADHSLDWYLPPMIEGDIWGDVPLPSMQAGVAPNAVPPINPVATELDVMSPPAMDPNMPVPAARPEIAPLAANAVDPEWNPLRRLLGAVMASERDRNSRPAVGTVLGTADNGGKVTQGHNGLLNSITQESDYWRRATGKSRGSGDGGGGARSLVGTR